MYRTMTCAAFRCQIETCSGNLSGTKVKCPLHGSRFDLLTGKVLDDPANIDLTTYPVTIVDDAIYIDIKDH